MLEFGFWNLEFGICCLVFDVSGFWFEVLVLSLNLEFVVWRLLFVVSGFRFLV